MRIENPQRSLDEYGYGKLIGELKKFAYGIVNKIEVETKHIEGYKIKNDVDEFKDDIFTYLLELGEEAEEEGESEKVEMTVKHFIKTVIIPNLSSIKADILK